MTNESLETAHKKGTLLGSLHVVNFTFRNDAVPGEKPDQDMAAGSVSSARTPPVGA